MWSLSGKRIFKYLYRGVPFRHHAFWNAFMGFALPGDPDGHADIERHNLGETRNSRLTCWTRHFEVALNYAGGFEGEAGVILAWDTSWTAEGFRFLASPDVFYEDEVLVEGVLRTPFMVRL